MATTQRAARARAAAWLKLGQRIHDQHGDSGIRQALCFLEQVRATGDYAHLAPGELDAILGAP